jgi:hypothetical protein
MIAEHGGMTEITPQDTKIMSQNYSLSSREYGGENALYFLKSKDDSYMLCNLLYLFINRLGRL